MKIFNTLNTFSYKKQYLKIINDLPNNIIEEAVFYYQKNTEEINSYIDQIYQEKLQENIKKSREIVLLFYVLEKINRHDIIKDHLNYKQYINKQEIDEIISKNDFDFYIFKTYVNILFQDNFLNYFLLDTTIPFLYVVSDYVVIVPKTIITANKNNKSITDLFKSHKHFQKFLFLCIRLQKCTPKIYYMSGSIEGHELAIEICKEQAKFTKYQIYDCITSNYCTSEPIKIMNDFAANISVQLNIPNSQYERNIIDEVLFNVNKIHTNSDNFNKFLDLLKSKLKDIIIFDDLAWENA